MKLKLKKKMPRFRSYNKGRTVVKRVDAWVKSQAAKAAQAARVAARAARAAAAAATAKKWGKSMNKRGKIRFGGGKIL